MGLSGRVVITGEVKDEKWSSWAHLKEMRLVRKKKRSL